MNITRFGFKSLMVAVALAAVICLGLRSLYRHPIEAEVARYAKVEDLYRAWAEEARVCYTDHLPNRRYCGKCRLQGGSMSFSPTAESFRADHRRYEYIAAHATRKRKTLLRQLDWPWCSGQEDGAVTLFWSR